MYAVPNAREGIPPSSGAEFDKVRLHVVAYDPCTCMNTCMHHAAQAKSGYFVHHTCIEMSRIWRNPCKKTKKARTLRHRVTNQSIDQAWKQVWKQSSPGATASKVTKLSVVTSHELTRQLVGVTRVPRPVQ